MATFLGDLKYGIRMLRAAPRLTIAALSSLALGIGATAAIFTVVNAVILRPLPFTDPERLVAVWETSPDNNRRWVAPANFLDWRRDTTTFEQLAAYDWYNVNLTGRERPERLRASSVSGNFFATLGIRAAVGRTFSDADDAAGAEAVAMLTHGTWQRLFAGDERALGRTLVLDGQPYVLVGILPQSFDFLGPDVEIVTSGDRGIPRVFAMVPGDPAWMRDVHLIYVVGRLHAGASIEQAQREVSTVMRRLEQEHPDTNSKLGARVVPLHADLVAESRTALLLLLGAVGCLLLIACVNVANLLLARAIARQREMDIRVSLGAGRGRLIRQVLTESAVLGLLGGIAGMLLARWGVPALLALAPQGLPRASEIRVDTATLLFAALVSLGTAVLFGLVPALQGTRRHHHPLQAGTARVSEGRSQRRMQQALVVSELTLAQVLLAGAALLIASFVNVHRADLGFNPDRLLAVELTLPHGKYSNPERRLAFNRAVLERMEALPGVRSAAATLTVPLRGAINRGIWLLDRPAPPPGQQLNIDYMIVSAGYFRTLGIPVVGGRLFTEHDTLQSPRVAIVSAATARRYWPGGNALGQRMRFGRDKEVEVVGVVGDVRQRDPARAAEPLLYIPLQQDVEGWNFIAFALRTDTDPATVGAAAREAVLAVDPDQPVARIRTIDEIADTLVAGRRFNTILLTIFSASALLLAAIGTYGVMAYSITRRTREIGVRMALGARPVDVLRMVLGQGTGLVSIAVAIGVAGALVTNRLLAQQLYEISATDPATLAAGAATLCAFALLACYVPARRAMKIAPLEALREE